MSLLREVTIYCIPDDRIRKAKSLLLVSSLCMATSIDATLKSRRSLSLKPLMMLAVLPREAVCLRMDASFRILFVTFREVGSRSCPRIAWPLEITPIRAY